MRLFYILSVISLILFSCEPTNELPKLDGSYVGSYVRGDSVAVIALEIIDYRFQGNSEYPFFPAMCMGTVGWDDYTIEFGDECEWDVPDDFDVTLFLNGRYTYAYSKSKLSFWRGTGDYREIYTIEKLKD